MDLFKRSIIPNENFGQLTTKPRETQMSRIFGLSSSALQR